MGLRKRSAMVASGPGPGRRVILLGASNLAHGISTVVETARLHFDRPLDVLAAHGHGRSYGMTSSMLGRQLPGITECDLWRELQSRAPLPTSALITDIGNDLAYGVNPAKVIRWVEECLDRLSMARAETIITSLPLDSLQRVTPGVYYSLRTLFFPYSRLSLAEVLSLACELDERIRVLASQRGIPILAPQPCWYGFDPIHIRLRCVAEAWQSILDHWPFDVQDAAEFAAGEAQCKVQSRRARRSVARWWRLKTAPQQQQRLLGMTLRRRQPSARLADGTMISFF